MFSILKTTRPSFLHRFVLIVGLAGLGGGLAIGQASAPMSPVAPATTAAKVSPPTPPAEGTSLQNVALLDLGASAKGSGVPINKDWPAENTLQSTPKGSGILMGGPLTGGRVDIHLIVPVDIQAIEVVPLDYHGTIQPKAIDIFVNGALAKHADLPHTPGEPIRIPLVAHGQDVGILVTDEYPVETLPDGKPGLTYGGWSRLRVLVSADEGQRVTRLLSPVDKYNVAVDPQNIAPTSGAIAGKAEVYGEPRVTKGHPCTLWDNQDIAHYKAMLKTNKDLQQQLAGLKKAMDVRITQPIGVPVAQMGPDGKWMHFSDVAPAPGGSTYGAIHNQLGLDVANLGTVYAMTGESKYGDFAKKILLAYADNYPHYGIGARPGFAHAPSIAYDQVLSDAIWVIQPARGYDLIHDLPSITPAERAHIENDFLKFAANNIVKNHSMIEASTNWSAVGTCAVLTIGYATDDQGLINTALYGIKGTPEKETGGLFDRHFTKGIDVDGLWVEGALGYQFLALQALVMDAEVLWHHGIDMYRFNDCSFKRLFDTPLELSYPDLTTPALHDSAHGSLFGGDSFLYEYAYRRYHDPKYLLLLDQLGTHIDAHYQQFAVSVLYDRDKQAKPEPVEWKSVNFYGVGYGIERMTTPAGTVSGLLEYGPARSHGHPDKLTYDLYAFNDQLMIDPGTAWYELPIYHNWYHTTLAHPTLTVDERDQIMCGAHQVVYGPANTLCIQRAWTRDAYPGVTMDRALFLTPNYTGDLFSVFARLPRTLDLAYHIRGQFASDLPLTPMSFPDPVPPGYNSLTNVRHASTSDQPFAATVTRDANVARLFMAPQGATEVIVGDGHYGLETPPAILERRVVAKTLYANALDYSGVPGGYVKGVTQEGSLDAGYGLIKVRTIKGTDLCFAAFTPGTYTADGMKTDAMQAYVLMDGSNVQALYLGGGKTLQVPGATLERSDSGLAYLEKAENGSYILGNPSPNDATVTATFAPLSGMSAFNLDFNGKRTGPATAAAGSTVTENIKAGAKVEFAPKGATSLYEFRAAMLLKRQQEQEAALAKARNECIARNQVREAEAKAHPVPHNIVLVTDAVDFTGQGGGEVKLSTTKRGAVGKTLNSWDAEGHWLEWAFDVPADGYYQLTLCYCSELDQIEREIAVNGTVQEPFATMNFPSTGGWANGSDDWRLFTATDGISDKPLLLKLTKGKNVIRLTNANGRGINVNYVAITSPDVKPTREMLAAKLPK